MGLSASTESSSLAGTAGARLLARSSAWRVPGLAVALALAGGAPGLAEQPASQPASGSSSPAPSTEEVADPGPRAVERAASAAPASEAKAPEHVQVQHILIGFAGSVRGKSITRTREEAKALADEVLARAKKGEDFGELVKKYTDDSFPGIYSMSNTSVPPAEPGERARWQMVKAFGDVSFSLGPGEIGRADFDPKTSRFGWHIIKRLK
jgi:hypothetical protein